MKSMSIQQLARFSKFYFSGGSRMVYRPLRSIGRFGLAACAVSLGVASLSAQSAPSTTAPVGPNPSRVDIFLGYSYFGAHGEVKPGYINYSSVNLGAIGSGAYYFNKYVGAEVVAVSHPDGVNDGIFTASGGLIVRAPMQNFTVFAHGLAGGAYIGGPNSENPATLEHEPYTWGPALTAGGGMDYDLPFFNNKFSLRLFQADYRYIHADYGPYTQIPTGGTLGGRANLSGVDLSTGIVAHFGHIIPPPPVTYACSVSPTSGYPGDPFTVTGTATNLNPKKTATYTWTSTGGTISGNSSTANIDTKNAQPGSYTVTGHISEGNKPGEMADCTAPFTIKAFEPPTISCSANPSTVNPGDSATITASGVSPQNRPLTYSYSATSGSINGTSSTATLSTTGAAPGTITVTCNVVDDKGQTASSTTQVTVQAPPPPPAPKSQSLCSISFDRDAKRPTRVDNEGKACLDDLALQLQNTTGATLDLVGNASTSEKEATTKAAERAVNTKDYLVKEKGIDASRIAVFTGTDDAKTVTSTLVPSGATPVSATPVDESTVKAQPRQPLHEAKHHHHHKKAASKS
jgi:outer membrane protein OmpA-like peptidoglycan-associated protein